MRLYEPKICSFSVIEMAEKKKITGKIVSGIGRGAFYVRQKPYFTLFRELLDGDPFPGTLNVVIADSELKFEDLPHYFKPKEFGDIKYAIGEIKDTKILVVRPCKSVHPDNVFEIIAPIKLREKYNFSDGDQITFSVLVSKPREKED